jgi:hypothetical protein
MAPDGVSDVEERKSRLRDVLRVNAVRRDWIYKCGQQRKTEDAQHVPLLTLGHNTGFYLSQVSLNKSCISDIYGHLLDQIG